MKYSKTTKIILYEKTLIKKLSPKSVLQNDIFDFCFKL